MSTDLIQKLIAANVPAALIAEVAMELGRAAAAVETLEKRRLKDRTRKSNPRNSAESVESKESAETAPSKESPHTPIETTPPTHPTDVPEGAAAPILDPHERCWAEGREHLMAMGLSSREAGSNIGRWLRDNGNDAVRVLGAICRARDHGTRNPIPLVGRILKPLNGNGFRHVPEARDAHLAATALHEWTLAEDDRDRGAPLLQIGRG